MTRAGNRLRLALDGPAGSGKTYTALRFAFAIARRFGLRVGVIDTEHGSAKLYIGVTEDGQTWEWDGVELQQHAPSTYTTAIQAAAREGIGVLVVDSLSHAWEGVGGALDQVDKARSKNPRASFTAWKDVTPQHRAMVNAILSFPGHVIATLRTKVEYSLEKDERGKTRVEKVGVKPIQREGVDYEFTIVCDIDTDHRMTVSKTRCPAIDGYTVVKAGGDWLTPVLDWLEGIEPETDRNAALVDDQAVQEIKRLAAETGTSRDSILAVLEKLGASRLAELTADQGEALLERLRSKSNGSSPATVPARGPAPDLAGKPLADEIKVLWKGCGYTPEKLRGFLDSKGVSTVAELPRVTAEQLRARLDQKHLEVEADRAFPF